MYPNKQESQKIKNVGACKWSQSNKAEILTSDLCTVGQKSCYDVEPGTLKSDELPVFELCPNYNG